MRILLGAVLVTGCGYRIGNLYEVRGVSVPVFNNQTERRLSEFELTNAVIRDIRACGVAVNRPDTDWELRGEITDIDQPTVVEGRQDVVIVGSVDVKIQVELIDKKTGQTLWKDSRRETAPFSQSRGRSLETARAEVFDRLARWIVSKLEKDWALE